MKGPEDVKIGNFAPVQGVEIDESDLFQQFDAMAGWIKRVQQAHRTFLLESSRLAQMHGRHSRSGDV